MKKKGISILSIHLFMGCQWTLRIGKYIHITYTAIGENECNCCFCYYYYYAASEVWKNNLNENWNPLKRELEHLFFPLLPTFFHTHNAVWPCVLFFPFDFYLTKVLAADSLEFLPVKWLISLFIVWKTFFLHSAFSPFSLFEKNNTFPSSQWW